MRVMLFSFVIFMCSCDTGYEIPDSYSGRYYGIDSIYRNQYALEIIDTLYNPIYLDVESLGSGLYDVKNDNGYWIRDGLLTQNKLAIDISGFIGFIKFFEDSIYLEATSNTSLINVSHKAFLSR
jgi:hypothetical protein